MAGWFMPPRGIGGHIVKNDVVVRRLVEAGALFLIGDGIMGLIKPRWHSRLWHFGPQLAIAVTEELAAHPNLARAVYAAEAAIGIAIASCSTPENH
jgi:hypothetical protein